MKKNEGEKEDKYRLNIGYLYRLYLKVLFTRLYALNVSLLSISIKVKETKEELQFYRTKYSTRDSTIGIAIGYGVGDQGVGVRFTVGARIFILILPKG